MIRRDAVRRLSLFLAGSPLLRAQDAPWIADRMPAIDDLHNVMEFEPVARTRMVKSAYDFIMGGVDDEWTMRRNREGFQRFTFRPRMLVDVSKLDLSLDLFGSKIEMPILIAPTSGHQQAHPDGELATVRAAGAVKTIMVVSTSAGYPIDKIGAAATSPFWFQLYAGPDSDATRERVERALAAGAKAVCLTLDAKYASHRERMLRVHEPTIGPPGRISGEVAATPGARNRTRNPASDIRNPPVPYRLQQQYTAQLTWPFLDDLITYAKVPVLLKGVLTPEDARMAVERGASGIVVSNHGGRYLESAPSTIEVLPEIVDAVGSKVPVLMDGGIRRGTDVLKALALGAKAVLIGRPQLWGLGAYGQAGVARVLELLQTELALAMGLSGRPNLSSIDRTLVKEI